MFVQTMNEQKSAVSLPIGVNRPQQVTGKGSARVNDSKAEENQLLAMASKLVSFAKETPSPSCAIPLSNTTLAVSFTEWQALLAQYPEDEQSFRADFNRVVRRATAIGASLQEEMALYKVRLTSQHLWKQHWNSLCHLEESAAKILSELKQQGIEARSRGLLKKAEDVQTMIGRMQNQLQQIPNLSPETITEKMGGLGLDPKWEETRLQDIISNMKSFAKSAAERVDEIPLSRGRLAVSATAWQALTTDYPETESSYRVDLNRVVREAVGILAVIQEELAPGQADGERQKHERNHLTVLCYMAYRAGKVLPELEVLRTEAQNRGLAAKEADTLDLIARMKQQINDISNLYQRWKDQTFGSDAASRLSKTQVNLPRIN